MYSIRKMEKDDIPKVIEIDERNFSLPINENILLSELNREMSYYVVIVNNDEIVGYGGMWEVLGEGHITHVCVDHPHRRRGLGDLLMNHLLGRLREINYFACFLEVRESNEGAIALYEKHGFTTIGLRKNYYSDNKEDALVLWKDILE